MDTSVEIQIAKDLVRAYYSDFDDAPDGQLASTLSKYVTSEYNWRGSHPFGELFGVEAVVDQFWGPLRASFGSLQRRPDVFMAGMNDSHLFDSSEGVWVCSMGHLMGLFDEAWLHIPPTFRMTFHRYAEFHHVRGGRITESALFVDILSIMDQAGVYPLPPQTGAAFVHPGPRTHDGLLYEAQDPAESELTMELVNEMIADLTAHNISSIETGESYCPPEVLQRTWHDDMIWYGPSGIGATYTIDRYQHQHQMPFRLNLTDKVFNGHVARFADGNYAGFFGWANLTNTPTGGFLGLPGTHRPADMRVVDVYRRDGDKLAENWVFIDILYWLEQQGLDVLRRMRQLHNIEGFERGTDPGEGLDG